jgi:hypothetical protein
MKMNRRRPLRNVAPWMRRRFRKNRFKNRTQDPERFGSFKSVVVGNEGFFADCQRDEHGHCLKGSEVVSTQKLKQVQEQAKQKAAVAPRPTAEEKINAERRIARLGGDVVEYRNQIKGNKYDRQASRRKLLEEFGDGKKCPCVYCGKVLTDATLTRDKIYTSRDGGRYRHSNTLPACLHCNQSRNDVPFSQIGWRLGTTQKTGAMA